MKSCYFIKLACPILVFALVCLLPPHARGQAAPTITLDPPTGLDLQAHAMDSNGNLLPEAPANFRRLGEARAGAIADLHVLTLRFNQSTRISRISVTRDFKVEQGGSCVEGNVYEKGASCRLLVRFTPQGPGHRLGRITVETGDSASPMFIGLGGTATMPVLSFIPAQITTVAGTYPSNYGLLNGASSLAVDGGDSLYMADTGNNLVRMLDSSGNISTIANVTGPWGVAADSFGEVFFSQPSLNRISEMYAYGFVITASGSGTTDVCNISTSPACLLASEKVVNPGQISIDPNDVMFFPEDFTLASPFGAAMSAIHPEPTKFVRLLNPFPYYYSNEPPTAMSVDANDNIYSAWTGMGNCAIVKQYLWDAEQGNHGYTKVAGTRFCGYSGDGGIAGNARIGYSIGQIAFDVYGNMYFTDSDNQRVRRIDRTTGIIRTIAGNGTAGYTNDNWAAPNAELANPTGVAVDSQGQVYIISGAATTGSAQVIRKVGANGFRSLGSIVKGAHSPAGAVVVSNTGNSAMVLANTAFTGPNAADFAVDPASTSCLLTQGSSLNAGQTCQIGFIFTPSATGARNANFVLLNNTVNNSNVILLTGTGILPAATFKVTSPSNGASFSSGSTITFSVSVTSGTSPAPTGTVQFKVDGTNLGSPITIASGAASTSISALTQTSHTLSATYSGDSHYAAGGPISITITVTSTAAIRQPTVTMSPVTRTVMSCVPETFNVIVSNPSSAIPTGTVHLLDGSHVVSTATLVNGKAVLSSPPLSVGTHSFTTEYGGDGHDRPAVSPAVVETISRSGNCSQPVDRVRMR